MVTTEMPIDHFLDLIITTARKNSYSSVMLFLSRTSENKEFQKHLHQEWTSIDDLTNSKILVVIPRNKSFETNKKGAISVMWNLVYNNIIQIVNPINYPYGNTDNGHRIANNISNKYKHYSENPMTLNELQKNLTLNTAKISEYFEINENWIPSAVLISLYTETVYVIKLEDNIGPFKLIKDILKENTIDNYISVFDNDNNGFHETSRIISNNNNINKWKISFLKPYETIIINKISLEKNNIREYLNNKNIEEFVKLINSLLSSIPNTLLKNINQNEAFYHIILQIALQIGIGSDKIKSEENTSFGRSDLVVILDNIIYILELKYTSKEENLSETALKQIIEKKYQEKYLVSQKNIVLVGIVFSSKTKQIINWKIMENKTKKNEY